MNKKKILGNAGEEYAERMLREKGYRIIEMNYRCKIGEIDIIAMDKDVLVFIEVKTRRGLFYGAPAESITKKKVERLKKLAQYFLQTKRIKNTDCRFDVVAINATASGFEAELIKNAFY